MNLLHVGDPVLEQVTQASRSRGEQLFRIELLDVLGQHEHGQARQLSARLDRRPQALVREGRRQPHIHHRHVGALL